MFGTKDYELWQGDCIELMQQIPDKSIDLILTDPPYEISNHDGGHSSLSKRKLSVKSKVDSMSDGFCYDKCFDEFLRICKTPNILIFCSNKQISKIMSFFENKNLSTTLLVWHKTNPSPLCNGNHLSDLEFVIYVRGKGATFNNDTPFEYKRKIYSSGIIPKSIKVHPAQKPIELLKRYIELHTKENDVVFDPFMGSGSTGVACASTGRRFVGVELNQEYFDIAKQRICQ